MTARTLKKTGNLFRNATSPQNRQSFVTSAAAKPTTCIVPWKGKHRKDLSSFPCSHPPL